MTREQAKAWMEIFHKLRCNYYEQLNINCIQERGALARVSAFNVINKAIGHNGLEKHWEVFKHYVDVCVNTGVCYMANGTEPTHYKPLLPPHSDSNE